MRRIVLILVTLAASCLAVYGNVTEAVTSDSLDVRVYFRQGASDIDLAFNGNGARIDSLVQRLEAMIGDSKARRIERIRLFAGASPEGSSIRNKQLSERRAIAIQACLHERIPQVDSLVTVEALGVDWKRLIAMVETSDVPYRADVLRILVSTPPHQLTFDNTLGVEQLKLKLMKLHGGVPWKYMYTHIFPELRGASTGARIEYYKEEPDTVALPFIPEAIEAVDTVPVPDMPVPVVPVIPVDTVRPVPVAERKPFYMAVKTNMLYDAFLVPNIGVEFYLGDYWSVAANWMYAWWHSNRHHNYWRTYGGDLEVRRWFGSKADEKPLTGHHAGIYGQMLTYDFELGGRGYLGDRWSWGAGVSYGYSLAVTRRLNIDFTIGIGYLHGEYREYRPIDGCYVWQATKMRNWVGPTKAEISLVWLIGHKNCNEKKGGSR